MIAVAMALAVASACGPRGGSPCLADLNGSHESNILVLQRIANALLEGRLPVADLNRDGKLDVLDLQAMLTETSAPVRPAQRAHAEYVEGYVCASRTHLPTAPPDGRKCEMSVRMEHEPGLTCAEGHIQWSILPSGRTPILRGPSPHSPPLPA